MDSETLNRTITTVANDLSSAHDRDFLKRVYSGGIEFYLETLERLGFTARGTVLDAGSGFGQWTVALAKLNTRVVGIDINNVRLEASAKIAKAMNVDNIDFACVPLDDLPYGDASFDAIFCFSVVYYTDWQKSYREFFRVLKPSGVLYVCTNGLGWYLWNIFGNQNASDDFNPRMHAIDTIMQTVSSKIMKKRRRGSCVVMSPRSTVSELRKLHFKDVNVLGDNPDNATRHIEPVGVHARRYLLLPKVFEVIATKSDRA